MKIYTYYTNCPGISSYDSTKLIIAWREVWASMGFEPFVLTEHHARVHPDWAELEPRLRALPTVNGAEYEFACYARWLALATVGGGFMCDFDVFPRMKNEDGSPASFPWPMTGADMNSLHIYQNHNVCPCFIYANPEMAMAVVVACLHGGHLGRRQINGREHMSDQYVLEDAVIAKEPWIKTHDLVREYGDAEWLTHPFVHLSNASTTPKGKTPRWKHVRDILKET